MNILLCNVGSTSLKYQLIEMTTESTRAKGRIERVGSQQALMQHEDQTGYHFEQTLPIANHDEGIAHMLVALQKHLLSSLEGIDCVGFKVVLAKDISGVQELTPNVLAAMEVMNPIAPAHNPPYLAAIRYFQKHYPKLRLIGSFETGFHQSLPAKAYLYSIPKTLARDYGIRRYGYHGASHEYVATRVQELMKRDNLKIVSCHLGGSGSLTAINNGVSVDTTLGFSLQTGIFHNNRCGDIDPFIPLYLQEELKMTIQEVKTLLTKQSGLFGLSGVSNDMRDIEVAAKNGNQDALECLETYAYYIRKQIGAYAAVMNGLDIIAFAGGIGENSAWIRELALKDLSFLGVELDFDKNQSMRKEGLISSESSRVKVYVIPTNEEIIVARKAYQYLKTHP